MKKAALVLGVIFMIGALVVFFLLRRLGPNNAAALVPQNTFLLLDAPDLAVTSEQWRISVAEEALTKPEIHVLVAEAATRFYQWSGLAQNAPSGETLQNFIEKLKPGRFFLAAEPLGEKVGWMMGCQLFGTQADQEMEMTRAKQVLLQQLHGSIEVYTIRHGSWYFASNSQEVLAETIDFSTGRRPYCDSLAATELYQKNGAQLFPKASLCIFIKNNLAIKNLNTF